ncbi:MAG: 30S ribosomal protein S12 methylthiotransferase RimO [Planctomycetota bacterium]
MISLGCAKNLVDSEGILGALVERGCMVAARAGDADVILINTCGFIADAREESFGVIEEAVALKEAGAVAGVVVVGCLAQLMGRRLAERFRGVDAWVGLTGPDAVAEACEKAANGESTFAVPDACGRPIDGSPRLRITPRHFAYLRIAEGCDNRCKYCLIPSIRGALRSKPMEGVVAEAEELVADGARELVIIAQDTTNYGIDLYGEVRLPALLRQLCDLEGIAWLRLLYTHPAHFSGELIAALAEGGRLLPYVDLPVQHANDAILGRMGRKIDQAGIRDLIGRIRSRVRDAVIRTSVIVGFPGEGEGEFGELLGFMRDVRFERLGAFAYSQEEGTPAGELPGQVPAGVKEERLAAVMALQQEIADEQSQALIGREISVVVDGKGIDGEWTGRTVRDAPEVDGMIKFEDTRLKPGTFGRAVVTDAYGYDLTGRMVMEDDGPS